MFVKRIIHSIREFFRDDTNYDEMAFNIYAETANRRYILVPKLGAWIELRDGTVVRVVEHNPNGYNPEVPELAVENAKGERFCIKLKDMHPKYYGIDDSPHFAK